MMVDSKDTELVNLSESEGLPIINPITSASICLSDLDEMTLNSMISLISYWQRKSNLFQTLYSVAQIRSELISCKGVPTGASSSASIDIEVDLDELNELNKLRLEVADSGSIELRRILNVFFESFESIGGKLPASIQLHQARRFLVSFFESRKDSSKDRLVQVLSFIATLDKFRCDKGLVSYKGKFTKLMGHVVKQGREDQLTRARARAVLVGIK